MIATVFPDIFKTTEFAYRPVDQLLRDIASGGKLRPFIEEIRQIAEIDEARANDLKKKLPGICFGGKFTKRMNSALVEASGLMILDFDKVDLMFNEKLDADPFIYAYWLSPRGVGYKALVKIPVVQDDAEYKRYFHSFQQRYPDLDPSGKDIARVCYFSFDPSLKIKEDAQLWDQTVEIKGQSQSTSTKQTGRVKTDWKKITIGIQMIQKAQVGNRHEAIIKAGRLMGGYIATGEIDESDVMNVLEKEIMSIMDRPEDFRTQWKTFLDGVQYGKADPIKTINETILEEKVGDIDFTLEGSVREKLNSRFSDNTKKGFHIGWDDFKPFYRVVLGYMTFIYGTPFSGKSQFWLEVLINLSKFFGMKHAIFSPETGTADEVFEELVQIYVGKDFTNQFNNQMTEAERDEAELFIAQHFIIIDPEELDVDLTPKDLLDYVDMLERKYNTKIHTLTIDPWNELSHDNDDRLDRYLEKQLKMMRRNAKKNNRHICIVTHTKEQKPITVKGDTFYPIATPHDIAGGPTWYRKGYMMLSFWRPHIYNNKDEVVNVFGRTLKRNSTIIQIQKSKPKGVGKRGEVEIYYDVKRHRFYESGDQYAHKIEDADVDVIQKNFVEITDDPPF